MRETSARLLEGIRMELLEGTEITWKKLCAHAKISKETWEILERNLQNTVSLLKRKLSWIVSRSVLSSSFSNCSKFLLNYFISVTPCVSRFHLRYIPKFVFTELKVSYMTSFLVQTSIRFVPFPMSPLVPRFI